MAHVITLSSAKEVHKQPKWRTLSGTNKCCYFQQVELLTEFYWEVEDSGSSGNTHCSIFTASKGKAALKLAWHSLLGPRKLCNMDRSVPLFKLGSMQFSFRQIRFIGIRFHTEGH